MTEISLLVYIYATSNPQNKHSVFSLIIQHIQVLNELFEENCTLNNLFIKFVCDSVVLEVSRYHPFIPVVSF